MNFSLRLALLISSVATALLAFAQKEGVRYEPRPIGFYNLENLYDTRKGPNDDAEYLC